VSLIVHPGFRNIQAAAAGDRLTEPARQGALRGDRPPARPPSGAGIAVAVVLRPPASRLTRQAAARAAGFMPSLPFFIRLLEPRSEHDKSRSGGRVRRRRAFPRERRSRPDGQQKTPGGGDRVDRWVAVLLSTRANLPAGGRPIRPACPPSRPGTGHSRRAHRSTTERQGHAGWRSAARRRAGRRR
jgi:hypothetical protein